MQLSSEGGVSDHILVWVRWGNAGGDERKGSHHGHGGSDAQFSHADRSTDPYPYLSITLSLFLSPFPYPHPLPPVSSLPFPSIPQLFLTFPSISLPLSPFQRSLSILPLPLHATRQQHACPLVEIHIAPRENKNRHCHAPPSFLLREIRHAHLLPHPPATRAPCAHDCAMTLLPDLAAIGALGARPVGGIERLTHRGADGDDQPDQNRAA